MSGGLGRPVEIWRDFERSLARSLHRSRRFRVGWASAHTLSDQGRGERLARLGPFLDMRLGRNARWINAHTSDIWGEIYDPRQRYDVVVFVKAMSSSCRAEARRVQAYGGKVIFDANVNYYEIWGEYDIPGTRPTEEQRAQAIEMTQLADWVVADSSYLLEIVGKHNPRASWIPDNVDLATFRRCREHRGGAPLRLVWSGVAHKAQQVLSIRDALRQLSGFELVVASERLPEAFSELETLLPCRFVPYSDAAYARTLLDCDVIVSPKRLVNGYEMGHTEYKITLGMAAGLPAVASPQPSYLEAVSHKGGGIIADGDDQWVTALRRLAADVSLRAELGRLARATVLERYATDVVAREYERVIRGLLR